MNFNLFIILFFKTILLLSFLVILYNIFEGVD